MDAPPGPTPVPEGEPHAAAPPRTPHAPSKVNPERAKALHRRQLHSGRDYTQLLLVFIPLFLLLMITYFLWMNYQSTRQIKTVYSEAPKVMLPVPELVRTPDAKELEDGRAEITYDFEKAARIGEGEDPDAALGRIKHMLKDWKGARNSPDETREKGREHESIRIDRERVPLAPLLSQVSFQNDLELEFALEARPVGAVWLFFNYFYDDELTGTALMLARQKGEEPRFAAQFVRYRREMLSQDMRGTPGALRWAPEERKTLRIVVNIDASGLGYACRAFDGQTLLTEARFPPEWPEDKLYGRYYPGDTQRRLVADNPIPPQAGFIGVASHPAGRLRILRVTARGTVAESWREERTRKIQILGSFEKEAQDLLREEGEALPADEIPGPPAAEE